MRYGVLGPLTVRDADGAAVAVPEAKVRAILVNLLVRRGTPVPADRLIHDLWGEHPPGRALNTLQTKLSQLRRALGPGRIVHGPAGYRLEAAADDVDACVFEDLVERADAAAAPGARVALASRALDLWRDDPFPELADTPSVQGEAARFGELRLSAVEIRAEAYLGLGESCCAAADMGELLAEHPLRERARALHMLALYREGRQSEALGSFEEARARLDEELGVDPGPHLTELHTAVLRQEPGLGGGAVARPSPGPVPRARLPVPATPMVGRERELDRLRQALSGAAPTRLATVTGPGGVGKTRLALAAARALAEEEEGSGRLEGVHLVELADADRDATAADLAERVGAIPAGHPTLLVLDNGEHVAGSVAELLSDLLARNGGLRALVTSQEVLDVPGESVIALEPLALPEAGADTAEAVRSTAAGLLFADRARDADPGFTLTDGNAPAVAEICRRLDGLPLALELVAARMRALGPERILAGLEDRFALPTGAARGRPRRQQTLRAMAEWSWSLLTETEQVVLGRLSAHPDRLTPELARTVGAGGPVRADEVDAVFARLVDRSLVLRDGDGFRLLGGVAAYGRLARP